MSDEKKLLLKIKELLDAWEKRKAKTPLEIRTVPRKAKLKAK